MSEQDPNGWINWCKHGNMYWYAWHFKKRKDPTSKQENFICEQCNTDPFIPHKQISVPIAEESLMEEEQSVVQVVAPEQPMKRKRGRPRKNA